MVSSSSAASVLPSPSLPSTPSLLYAMFARRALQAVRPLSLPLCSLPRTPLTVASSSCRPARSPAPSRRPRSLARVSLRSLHPQGSSCVAVQLPWPARPPPEPSRDRRGPPELMVLVPLPPRPDPSSARPDPTRCTAPIHPPHSPRRHPPLAAPAALLVSQTSSRSSTSRSCAPTSPSPPCVPPLPVPAADE